ncbi:YfjI family protein [Psychrobacter immobilis]|uniref:YfjI family protein n=1 Tax=Psychrobacter immobilis TaxID=498 RepID=UPI001917A46A|nr:YfjI family protein [Psychrobacter immobilis]
MTMLKDNKTHAINTGLSQYIADIRLATFADVAGHDALESILSNGSLNSVIYLDRDITIFTGTLAGVKQLYTTNTIGLVMLNNQAEQINLASIPLEHNGLIFISDTNTSSAFVIGSMSKESKWIVIADLAEAVRCYNAYRKLEIDVTVLTCLIPSLFNQTVKHFAEVQQVTIMTTSQHKAKVITPLKGVNVEAIICEHTLIYDALEFDADYDDLIADAEVIDLQALGKPKPKPISQTLPPVKTLTSDMMPKLLWDYASNSAERLSVPIEYVLMPLMVSLGSLIGSKLSIYPKMYDNWEVVPNFYGAIIGNPSSKKSPSLSDGLKPISHLVALASDKYKEDKLEHDTQKELNKHMTKAAEKQLSDLAKKLANQTDDDAEISQDDLKVKAQELAEAKQSDELIPEIKRYLTDDGTIEGIGELESKHKNGMLVKRDELTAWFASLESESNQQARSFYLEGFNGLGSFQVDRIGRGSVFIDTHCLSVIGGIQPDKLEYYLSKTMKGLGNDGLIQRFQLMVYPDPLSNSKERDLPPDKQSRDAIYNLFETIDSMQLGDFMRYGANPIDDYHKRPYYRFTDDAYQLFMSWYDALKLRAGDAEHSIIAEHLIKYAKTVPSLALVFHLVDCIEHGTSSGAVNMNALRAALAWCEVLESHMMRIYSTVTDSANIKASYLADKIMKMVKKGADKTDTTDWISHGFTARQLIRKGWKGLNDADDVLNSLEVLIENNWLSWQVVPSTGKGGRPTERYYINPRISELL